MAEFDISPELLEELKNEFWKQYNGNKKINAAVNALRGSEGLNYKEAYNYSFEVGKSLTGAIRETARSDILPDGRMYYNIADKALRPMFENNYRLISDYCVKTQNALNERADIGIKGVAAPINEDRVNGLLNVAAAAQQFDDIVGEFCRECENYSLSVVDEHIKKNAEIQNSAGLSPKIERFCGHSGCDWCSSLAGTYEYEKVKDTGNDVFRRHRGCTCTVVFIPINGRAENAHTKYYIPDKELIELRKNYVGVDRSGRGGIINTRAIRNMANGMRTPPTHILNEQEIESIKSDIKIIGADEKVFRFNSGRYTGYNDDGDFINIRGDIIPDKHSKHPRDVMSQRAVIAHEYYGHRAHRGTKLPKGSWNDEFRASYSAAKNCPNLSDEDRYYLVLDALERAKEKGVSIKYNSFIRGVLYGY